MKLPKQSPPIKRADLIQPHEAVDVVHGSVEDLVNIRIKLLHGANFNDPAGFGYRSYNQLKTSGYGCFDSFAGMAL
ncbi:cyanobactin biosynthesis system PatB/AcyB/McaB family protein [Nostoc sp. CHAB 5784]|uniref:cyanobactin biosynthesis system PatB/AcyB/McaB family protein n=1 Tax=Nostoc mirabile TaxID=2907820 RepID=UPI001E61203F|nr:cyanobactin biosynthesis system PatB/AcyB/McaB family protein [Nostoc mirabile]MCC5669246.1 cyanobactin biosynthesis system PatB/AcyB/McaB family protein [Nostoc mirabile CHAB5784]